MYLRLCVHSYACVYVCVSERVCVCVCVRVCVCVYVRERDREREEEERERGRESARARECMYALEYVMTLLPDEDDV